MTEETIKIAKAGVRIRLAIRKEGNWLNAYLANSSTMEGAELIGSLRINVALRDPEIFERWKNLMVDALADIIADVVGTRPEMVEHDSPAYEKAGSA